MRNKARRTQAVNDARGCNAHVVKCAGVGDKEIDNREATARQWDKWDRRMVSVL